MAFVNVLIAATAMLNPITWTSGPDGDLALVSFKTAPFPHSSRDSGYQTKAKFYPRDPHYTDSTVGIFIPKGFIPKGKVNFVVHFHGHNNHVSQVFDQFTLGKEMHDSGVNAVLLVPQGPRDAADSSDGKLQHDAGSLEAMLNEALTFLKSESRILSKATIGHVALTSHSGGYLVTSSILERNELSGKISDVILFDSTYGGLPAIANWCAADHSRRLISICTDHLGHENAQLIALLQKRHVQPRVFLEEDLTAAEVAKRGPMFVLTTTLEHNDVVAKQHFFSQWLHPLATRWGK